MMKNKTKRILVAGGAGFLGANLCRALLEQGHHVMVLDNLSTGKKGNISALLKHPHFEFFKLNVRDTPAYKVDWIFNLASPASPVHYQSDPIETVRTIFEGTLRLLELARGTNARFIQASTSEIYGEPKKHPQREDYNGNVNPIGPRACYDEGKRVAETLVSDFRRHHGVDARIVRLFNTYGPFMRPDDGRVVSNFIVQALSGKALTIYGDGSQTRSFCYVDDMIKGLIRMMEHPNETGPVNLGNPKEFTIKELGDLVLELTDSRSKYQELALPADDPTRRRPNIQKAKKILKWKPEITLEEGLLPTIEWFKKSI